MAKLTGIMPNRTYHTLSLVISARDVHLFMTLSAPAALRVSSMQSAREHNDLTHSLPPREREVIMRMLDSCQHYGERQELELADTVERIGMTMTQAYLNRAKDD
ncbi:hypothetical protein [Celeribacter sp.]|uniref:hypothetical protein n=1 Tax=Celeribacter sp. TaxID=1890673 RepID=UPI003A8E3FE6